MSDKVTVPVPRDNPALSITITAPRHAVERWLYNLMHEASQECYAAGWLSGTEEEVPAVCRALARGGADPDLFGLWATIDPLNAMLMCRLADALGYWVNMEVTPYIPRCDAEAIYNEVLAKGKTE